MLMALNISTLNRKKGNIKAQINKLKAIKETENFADISAHLNILEKLQKKFEDLKLEYYQLASDEEIEDIEICLSEIDNELLDLEVRFTTSLHNCKSKIDYSSDNSNFSVNNANKNETSNNLAIKLPEIPLPVFTGKIEEWSTFKIQFESLINDNKLLSESQKLYYLRAALKDEAKNIQTSDDSYDSLFKALDERFNNKRLLVDMHIKNIINYEKLTQESARDLRKFLDCITKNLRALKILNYEKDKLSNVLLLNIVLQKLAIETRKQYELSLETKDVPEFDDLIEFLEKRCLVLNNISRNLSIKPKFFEKNNTSKTLLVKSPDIKNKLCILCKNAHALYKCDMFVNFTPEKRFAFIKKNNLCLNCFGFHKVTLCRSKYSCSICNSKHNTLLHRHDSALLAPALPSSEEEKQYVPKSKADDEISNNSQNITSCFASESKKVLLATAIIYVRDINGSFRKARAILDNGSMCSCISAKFAKLLGFKEVKVNIPVSGLSGCSVNVKRKIRTSIANKDQSFSSQLDLLILPCITDLLPGSILDVSKLEIPANINLADPFFFKPGAIDILISAEIFFDVLLEGKIKTAQSLTFIDTVFGYVCSGTIKGVPEKQHCGLLMQENTLEETMKKFWEVESVLELPNPKSKEEIECEEHFLKTHKRDENGKYIVKLPLKKDVELGESYGIARRKLNCLWKRLNLSPEMSSLYSNFMEEYENLGHMEELKDVNSFQCRYIMPHHEVYRPDSDEELPLKKRKIWERFRSVLTDIKSLKIPRYVFINSEVKDLTIHGFSDASKDAYGASVYLRCVTNSDDIKVTLLCSKSRVAPMKVLTIPRLELCAAELLSKLVSKVLLSLNVEVSKVYLYTDSTIVLAWIDSSPHLLKVFVSNRISRIQELTKEYCWKWVSTNSNPADLISRGTDPDQILNNSIWLQGPDFLHQDISDSSSEHVSPSDEHYLQEFKKPNDVTLTVIETETFLDFLFSVTNSFSKLIRIVSFIFRFYHNVTNPRNKKCGALSVEEIQNSKLFLIKCVQVREFKEDINNLQKNNPVTGNLKSLNPFIDNDNILRVGGRLQNCNINANTKHPIVLPARHKLTNMIIEYFHKKYFHVGPQNLLYCVRNEYWPLKGRATCRKIVHNCITCFKAKPLTSEQIMGNLPKERVNSNFIFNCTGVDFCGPFFIKYRGQRKGIFHKIYVCIFVCMVTKAIHLDIVCDLTSQAFIATLKRFFARRGRSQKMFSDNAKNFVSANAELKRLWNLVSKPDNELSNYLTSECIEWKFLPPRAPNFGGLWEAGVKSFKHHFKRVVGNSKLTYEEFLTVMCQIEGILNSRPLTPLSDDIDDLEVLTPGHFLIGRAINAISEPNVTNIPENRLNLWQRTTKMVQTIWSQWRNNYLNTLQQRYKWMVLKNNIKIGDMVILKEENLPICKWVLGRIVEIFAGNDNNVRVVKVKTQNGIFKRSITKIAVLPLDNK